jgi:hypothetical protein
MSTKSKTKAADTPTQRGADRPLTLSVPEAGKRYFGLSRNGSYLAADRGDIPTVRVGRLRRVPIKAMDRKLEEAELAGA